MMKSRFVYYAGVGIVFLAAVLQYLPLKDGAFLADDYFLVNTVVEHEQRLARVFTDDWILTGKHEGGYYRPLIIMSFYADYLMWGLRSTGFHITNILIHAFNSVLVFIFILLLFYNHEKRIQISLIGGLLFAIHPRHIESIAWIAARTDLLCAFFFLLTLMLYLYFIQLNKKILFLLSVSCFVAALLSKETAVMLPLIIVGLELAYRGEERFLAQHRITIFYRTGAFFIILGGYLIVRLFFLGSLWGHTMSNEVYGVINPRDFMFDVNPLGMLRGVVKATVALCLPSAVISNESIWGIIPRCFAAGSLQYLLAAVLCLVAGAILLILYRRNNDVLLKRSFLLSILGYLLSVLPFNKAMPLFGDAGERFLYIPSLFFIIAFSIILFSVVTGMKYFYTLSAAVAVFYVVSNIVSIKVWLEGSTIVDNIRKKSFEMMDDLKRYDRIVILNVPGEYCGTPLFGTSADIFAFRYGRDVITPRLIDCTASVFSDDTLMMPIHWQRSSDSTFVGQARNNRFCFSANFPTIQGTDTLLVIYGNTLQRGVQVKGHNVFCKIFAEKVEVTLHGLVNSSMCFLSFGKGIIEKVFEEKKIKQ